LTARFWILILLIAAIVAAFVVLAPRLEGEPPVISEIEAITLGSEPRSLVVEVSDEGSGLRSVSVQIVSSGEARTVAESHHPGSFMTGGQEESERIEIPLDVSKLDLSDGTATLLVVARDWSLRDGLDGNRSEQSATVVVDTEPPGLDVHSGLTYVERGGAGAVVYRVGEPTARDGVRVGDSFFAGHPLPGNDDPLMRVAIFAIPVEAPDDPSVRVVAQDAAGNESDAGFPVRISERSFEKDRIGLSERFLDSKVRPLAEAHGLAGATAADSFKAVNEVLRERNEARIRAIVENASSTRHWQGGFQQMPNSKVTSRFAERRTYLWNGRPISQAIHYGFDLASTSGASVTASNAGVVVFAEDLGIYGQCVIVDHGLGIHSLYGHLSRIDVKPGETVSRGQSVGRSGATGLAGGDHLHFAILVGGEYVDPMEWWDPKWVRSHVEWRLAPEGATGG
jgi:murein DD-endopeptidase MepM/ murein hydrolase activator NlpD